MEYVIETVEGLEFSFPQEDVGEVTGKPGGELKFVDAATGHLLAYFRPGGWTRWFLREVEA